MITDERIARYIEALEAELPPLLREIEKEALSDHVPIIKKPARSLLRFLIQMNRPKRILEVGTAVGFSSILMSEYLSAEGEIVTIEKDPERIVVARHNLERTGRDRCITLLEGDAKLLLRELADRGEIFDMVFMDAAKGQYLHFMPDVLRLLSVGGLLVSDNVLQEGDIAQSRFAVPRRSRTIHARMREYLYELTHNPTLDTIVLPVGDGITLSTKQTTKDILSRRNEENNEK